MTKRSVFFAFLLSVYCSPVSVAQLYTDEVQVVNGLGGKVGVGTNSPSTDIEVISKPSSNATIKLRQPSEQAGWGISLGQDTGYTGFLSAPGRDLLIQAGWNKIISIGVEQMTANNGKVLIPGGNVGIGTSSPSQKLSVNGNASKATAGDWLANSDARLKTNISPLHSEETLQKMLQLQGITYEWNDDKTGLTRPTGIQYGFTAQNIQEVFPSLVVEDDKGYLQSSYSTYDAMLVESIRALHEKIEWLERENGELRVENASLKNTDKEMLASIRALQEQMLSLLASQAVSAKNENHQSKSEIK